MSIQWALAAAFLYIEMGFLFLMCLPIISSARWSKIFNSQTFSTFLSYSHLYFNVFVVAMLVLFFDSMRESYKFREDDWAQANPNVDPRTSMQFKMRLFRAQRNIYITGFALFLLFVLRRVIGLHQSLSKALASSEAAVKQAKSVSSHCEQLMEEVEDLKKSKGLKTEKSPGPEDIGSTLDEKAEELAEREEELLKTKADLEHMKKQAEGVSKEYDRLLDEHSKLQAQIESNENKKDD